MLSLKLLVDQPFIKKKKLENIRRKGVDSMPPPRARICSIVCVTTPMTSTPKLDPPHTTAVELRIDSREQMLYTVG